MNKKSNARITRFCYCDVAIFFPIINKTQFSYRYYINGTTFNILGPFKESNFIIFLGISFHRESEMVIAVKLVSLLRILIVAERPLPWAIHRLRKLFRLLILINRAESVPRDRVTCIVALKLGTKYCISREEIIYSSTACTVVCLLARFTILAMKLLKCRIYTNVK